MRAALKTVRDSVEYAYVVTGAYPDFPFYLGPSKDAPRIGSFDVVAKKAVLLGMARGELVSVHVLSRCSLAFLAAGTMLMFFCRFHRLSSGYLDDLVGAAE